MNLQQKRNPNSFQNKPENQPEVSIIILSYHNWTLTETCIRSIIENTTYPDYEIIIVDNASDPETQNNLRKISNQNDNIRVLFNPKNYSFAKANNLGASIAKGSFLVFLNNDTIVSEAWLSKLLFHIQNIPDAGMVGPVTNAIGNEAKIPVNYVNPSIDAVNKFAKIRSEQFSGQYFKIKNLALFCSIIPKQLFEKVGGLDERYKIGMFDDDDLAMKIKHLDLNLYCAEDVFIHHYHGGTFNKLSKIRQLLIFQINKYKFEKKWETKWVPHQNRPNNP
jgi:GT2 family glycosyltransferase